MTYHWPLVGCRHKISGRRWLSSPSSSWSFQCLGGAHRPTIGLSEGSFERARGRARAPFQAGGTIAQGATTRQPQALPRPSYLVGGPYRSQTAIDDHLCMIVDTTRGIHVNTKGHMNSPWFCHLRFFRGRGKTRGFAIAPRVRTDWRRQHWGRNY